MGNRGFYLHYRLDGDGEFWPGLAIRDHHDGRNFDRNGAGCLGLFSRGGTSGLCPSGDACRGQKRISSGGTQFLAGARQRTSFDGDDAVYHVRHLLGVDDSVNSTWLVRVSEWNRSVELGAVAGVVRDRLQRAWTTELYRAHTGLDAWSFAALLG